MTTVRRERKNKTGRANTAQPGFAKWLGTAVFTGVLMTTPNFINNKGGYDAMAEKQKSKTELTTEQEKKLAKMGKECADLFLNFIKTGDSKHYVKFNELSETEFGEKRAGYYVAFNRSFKDALKMQAKNDPGLNAYIEAYTVEKGKLYAEKFFTTTNDLLFKAENPDGAESEYGKATVYAFTNMMTWRLAAYAAELTMEAFDPAKYDRSVEKMDEIAETDLLGIPLLDYDNFLITYDKQIAKGFSEDGDLVKLWGAYKENVGPEQATILGLLTDVYSCAELISEGKKKAEKEYGEDFVAAVTEIIPFTPKKIATPPEEKTYTKEEIIGFFKKGNINELINYLELDKDPIGKGGKKAKKEKSERVKFVQMLYNEYFYPNDEFQEYLKNNPRKELRALKKKQCKVNGNYKSFINYAKAMNYFLKDESKKQGFKGKLLDAGIYPVELSKTENIDGMTLKGLAAYAGLIEKAKPISLEEQVEMLSTTDRDFYEENIAPWLEEKSDYTVLNLQSIVNYVFDLVRNKNWATPVPSKKLEPKTDSFEEGGLIIRTSLLAMKPSELSEAVLSGKDVVDALDTLMEYGPVKFSRSGAEKTRISTVELILDNFMENIGDYIPEEYMDVFSGIKPSPAGVYIYIDGIYDNKQKHDNKRESTVVKAIQDFLFEYTRDDAEFDGILKELGIDYKDLKADGIFDEPTATAFAAYISYRKGTWEDEKEKMAKEKVAEEKPEKKEGKKEKKPKEELKPGETKIKLY